MNFSTKTIWKLSKIEAGSKGDQSVVQGKVRNRTQISAADSREDLSSTIRAFAEVKRELRTTMTNAQCPMTSE